MQIFTALLKEPDLERELVDGSMVKADQLSPGAVGQDNPGIEKKSQWQQHQQNPSGGRFVCLTDRFCINWR